MNYSVGYLIFLKFVRLSEISFLFTSKNSVILSLNFASDPLLPLL